MLKLENAPSVSNLWNIYQKLICLNLYCLFRKTTSQKDVVLYLDSISSVKRERVIPSFGCNLLIEIILLSFFFCRLDGNWKSALVNVFHPIFAVFDSFQLKI